MDRPVGKPLPKISEESVGLGAPRLVSGPHPNPLPRGKGIRPGPHPAPLSGGEGTRGQAARRESLREAVLKVERRWGVRASGRLFAGSYAPPLGLATGLPDLDRATGFGGIPRGKLSEITGSRSSGRLTLAMRALAVAVADGGLAAYIDLPGQFYPPAASTMGTDLRRLVVVRPDDIRGAERAALTLLSSEGFEAVLLDLAGEIPRASVLARLAGLAGRAVTACMVTTERGLAGLRFYSSLRLNVARRGWLWHEGPMGRAPAGMRLGIRILKTRSAAGLAEFVVDCPFTRRQVGAEDDLHSDTQVSHVAGDQGASRMAVATPGYLQATG